jgi:hypothetical protein
MWWQYAVGQWAEKRAPAAVAQSKNITIFGGGVTRTAARGAMGKMINPVSVILALAHGAKTFYS